MHSQAPGSRDHTSDAAIQHERSQLLAVHLGRTPGSTVLEKKRASRARDELIAFNYPLVVKAARKHVTNINVDQDDLVQEGLIALTKSVDTYDTKYTVRLSTWSFNNIRYAITKLVAVNGPIMPDGGSSSLRKLASAAQEISLLVRGRELTVAELVIELNADVDGARAFTAKQVQASLSGAYALSLDAPTGNPDGSQGTLGDQQVDDALSAHDAMVYAQLDADLAASASIMTARQHELMMMLGDVDERGKPMTGGSIATALGVSKQTVNKQLKIARLKLATHYPYLQNWTCS
jgi:RNA polymerase sigma factor (sigma-70 family)